MLWATNGDTLDGFSIGLKSDIVETNKGLKASKKLSKVETRKDEPILML